MKQNPLSLKTLVCNDATDQQELLGKPVPIGMYTIADLYVYTIDTVRPYIVEGNNYSIITSGGLPFTVAHSVDFLMNKMMYWK